MGSILDGSRENENTRSTFTKFFSKNHPVYEIMLKNVVETKGPQMMTQYGAYALRAGFARLHACMRMHTPMCPGNHMHTQTNK
jgi:hypothetical protein